MTSQKSYNNLGKNVRDQLHKMRSAILLLGVLYLAAGPVWFLLQMTSYPKYSSLPLLTNLYVGYFHVFYFLALALGTVGGFYATRYQNVPQQSNFYHSLPVTRQGLLSARILALVLVQVLLLIVVTMVDVGVVLMTASHVSGALAANLVGAAGIHFCYIMLVFLLALAVSLFAGQLTANTIGQVLMTAVLHLSVPFVGAVFMGICSTFTSTVGNVGLLEHLTRFNIRTGFMAMITSANDHINTLNPALVTAEDAANFAPQQLVWDPVVTILYVVLAVALFVGTYVLYNRRAVEKAGDTLLYPMVGNVIKALYVFLGGVVCGLFFWSLVAETMIGFVIGAVIAMVVVHLIAEMLYSMDVDGVRRHYISSIVGLAVALVVSLGFHMGLFDLDHHLPDTASVKGAVIAYSDDNDSRFDVKSKFATDPQTVEKIMTAAAQAEEKNLADIDSGDPDMPDVVDLNLAYGTMFGKTTRHFTLTVEDAQAIMAPLLGDANVSAGAWSAIAEATINDVVELYVCPPFGDLVGGYETWLIESENSYSESGEGKLVKNKEDGARRAEELLKAIQSDIAKRDRSVFESRVVAKLGYGVLAENDYNEADITYGNVFTIYEGDKATTALLAKWREEGFLDDEQTQLNEMLEGYEATVYDQEKGNGEGDLGTMSSEAFVNAYLAGDLVSDSQARNYNVPLEKDIVLGLCDGPVDDEDTAIFANYYVREGARDALQMSGE